MQTIYWVGVKVYVGVDELNPSGGQMGYFSLGIARPDFPGLLT